MGHVQHLPDLHHWENNIIRAIHEQRSANFKDMKTLNDFKLLQLSWVFDLNFQETSVLATKRGDLAAIARSLPEGPAVERAVDVTLQHLNELASTASS